MNATTELAACRLRLADATGAISRWCSLSGNVPVVTKGVQKAEAELEAFSGYLDHLAAKKRASKPLQF
jgi:hypothetical protein